MTALASQLDSLRDVQPMRIGGTVAALRGLTVLVDELPLPVGSLVAVGGSHGEVVGFSNGDGVADLVGVYWDRDGNLWNLDEVTAAAEHGWHFQQAFDINDHGDIVGWGRHDGVPRGFLLVNQNPEPGTLGVIVLAAAVALLRRRNRPADRSIA